MSLIFFLIFSLAVPAATSMKLGSYPQGDSHRKHSEFPLSELLSPIIRVTRLLVLSFN